MPTINPHYIDFALRVGVLIHSTTLKLQCKTSFRITEVYQVDTNTSLWLLTIKMQDLLNRKSI